MRGTPAQRDVGAGADGGAVDSGAGADAGMKPLSLEASEINAKVRAAWRRALACVARAPQATRSRPTPTAPLGSAWRQALVGALDLERGLGGYFRVDEDVTMSLAGETKAGTPTGIVLVHPAEPAEGEPAPRLRCVAGGETAYARFRVVDADGVGVPAVRVKFEALGGLVSVTPRFQDSNAQGEVTVQGICPSRMILGGQIQASLPDVDAPPKALGVEVEAGVIERVAITPFGEWPDPVRSGAELTVRVTAYDADGNAVTRAVVRCPAWASPTRASCCNFALAWRRWGMPRHFAWRSRVNRSCPRWSASTPSYRQLS